MCVHAQTQVTVTQFVKTDDYVFIILTQSKPFYDLVLCFIPHEGHILVSVKGVAMGLQISQRKALM